jgi:predicted RecB family nuclease
MMKVTLPAILSGVASRKDRSYTLKFETRELRGEEAAILLDQLQAEGWLLFSSNELKEADIPDEKADSMTGQKTQAQRLRGVVYRLWEQNGKKGNSEEYYRTVMESLIDQLKEKLD